MLRHWSQFVPNMSTDIPGHEALHHHLLQNTELFGQSICVNLYNWAQNKTVPLFISFVLWSHQEFFKLCVALIKWAGKSGSWKPVRQSLSTVRKPRNWPAGRVSAWRCHQWDSWSSRAADLHPQCWGSRCNRRQQLKNPDVSQPLQGMARILQQPQHCSSDSK